MPRVRIPNASLIASADLPILPFLAPRAFADYRTSSWSQPSRGKHDVSHKKQERRSCTREESPFSEHSIHRHTSVATKPVNTGTCRGLVPKSFTTRRVGIIYAEISFFTRQYHTQRGPVGGPASTSKRPHGNIRRVRSKKITRNPAIEVIGLRKRDANGYIRRIRSNQRSPTGRLLDLQHKRNKALSIEKRRLENYVSRLPSGIASRDRFRSGQYRSLQRRVTTLRTWEDTTLSLMGPITEHSRKSWLIHAFSALDRSLYKSIGKHTRKLVLVHDPRCARLSAQLFSAGRDRISVAAAWMNLDLQTRRAWYERLSMYLLDRKPARALAFIEAVSYDAEVGKSGVSLIADALGHLAKVHQAGFYPTKLGWSGPPEVLKREYVAAFIRVFRKALAKRGNVCSQDLLYNLVDVARGDGLKEVFECLKTTRTVFNFDTLLHYANSFAREGETQTALECLEELKSRFSEESWAAIVGRERLRWSCALILRKSMSEGQRYHDTTAIVGQFVKLGIKLDILLYNVIMHNAMEAGDYRTAFKVYNTLEGNGLKPDQHTLSIMLQGCSSHASPVAFKTFAQHCAEFALQTKDQWLATDYLSYVNMCHQNDTDLDHSSAVLWKAYLSFFSGLPLEPFIGLHRAGLRHAIDEQTNSTTSSIMAPTPLAFSTMLHMEIRLAEAGNVQRLRNLYRQFRVLAKRPELESFTKEPAVWNLFLLAFCKKQQFANASEVIKDMTDGSPQPNVYSWNIFMQAFFKADQIQAAERVYEIMKIRGVTPDQYTYGVLLRGYAKAQLVDKIGMIMQQLDAEQEMNPELLQALSKVNDRAKLMSTLEQSRIQKLAAAKMASKKRLREGITIKDFLRARGESTSSTAPMDNFLQSTHSYLQDDGASEPEPSADAPSEVQKKPKTWSLPLFGQTSTPSRFSSMLSKDATQLPTSEDEDLSKTSTLQVPDAQLSQTTIKPKIKPLSPRKNVEAIKEMPIADQTERQDELDLTNGRSATL